MGKWKPGVSGNPRGRPRRGESLSEALRDQVDARKLAKAVLEMAYSGSVPAVSLVFDRVEGRCSERVALTGGDGGPIQVDQTTRRALVAYLDQILSDGELEKLGQTLDQVEGGA